MASQRRDYGLSDPGRSIGAPASEREEASGRLPQLASASRTT